MQYGYFKSHFPVAAIGSIKVLRHPATHAGYRAVDAEACEGADYTIHARGPGGRTLIA